MDEPTKSNSPNHLRTRNANKLSAAAVRLRRTAYLLTSGRNRGRETGRLRAGTGETGGRGGLASPYQFNPFSAINRRRLTGRPDGCGLSGGGVARARSRERINLALLTGRRTSSSSSSSSQCAGEGFGCRRRAQQTDGRTAVLRASLAVVRVHLFHASRRP